MSSRAAIDFLLNLALKPEDIRITLLHVFRKPSAGEELMGGDFIKKHPERQKAMLEETKKQLVEKGFKSDNIKIEFVTDPYPTVADGILDYFKKDDYNMVVIGRKQLSKAEEFVLGDPSIKLVRALEGTAVMIVKSS